MNSGRYLFHGAGDFVGAGYDPGDVILEVIPEHDARAPSLPVITRVLTLHERLVCLHEVLQDPQLLTA